MQKNWKTTIIGAVYAALILVLQAFTTNIGIDWITVVQAAVGVLLGLKATDVNSLNVYDKLIVHWQTSIIGILTGAGTFIFTEMQTGSQITLLIVFKAFGVAVLGFISSDTSKKEDKTTKPETELDKVEAKQ